MPGLRKRYRKGQVMALRIDLVNQHNFSFCVGDFRISLECVWQDKESNLLIVRWPHNSHSVRIMRDGTTHMCDTDWFLHLADENNICVGIKAKGCDEQIVSFEKGRLRVNRAVVFDIQDEPI